MDEGDPCQAVDGQRCHHICEPHGSSFFLNAGPLPFGQLPLGRVAALSCKHAPLLVNEKYVCIRAFHQEQHSTLPRVRSKLSGSIRM